MILYLPPPLYVPIYSIGIRVRFGYLNGLIYVEDVRTLKPSGGFLTHVANSSFAATHAQVTVASGRNPGHRARHSKIDLKLPASGVIDVRGDQFSDFIGNATLEHHTLEGISHRGGARKGFKRLT